jgi:hypothetical protein
MVTKFGLSTFNVMTGDEISSFQLSGPAAWPSER